MITQLSLNDMDIEKAIEWQQKFKQSYQNMPLAKPKVDEACDFTIAALRELQLYRLIGTVDECRAAKEKQIPQKPEMVEAQSQGLIGDGTHTDKVSYQSDAYECPNCGSFLGFKTDCCDDEHYQDHFCSACGQALKWGD